MEEIFRGFVQTRDENLIGISIYKTQVGKFLVYNTVHEGMDDVWYDVDEFVSTYALKLYSTVEDFKRGDSISADRILV